MKMLQKIYNTPLQLELYIFLAALWLAIGLNFHFLSELLQLSGLTGLHGLLFIITSSLILSGYMYLCLSLLIWRYTAKLIMLPVLAIAGLAGYVCNLLGIPIDAYQIQNVVQTDAGEALDLITSLLLFWCVIFVVIPIFVFYKLKIRHATWLRTLCTKLLSITAVLALSLLLIFFFYLDLSSTLRNHREIRDLISPQNLIHGIWSYHKKLEHPALKQVTAYGQDAKIPAQKLQTPPKLFILVVGETARAESFSLNGYARNTNPELSQQQIINFSQVSSCGTATAVSVPCMFSGMPRLAYNERSAYSRENLLDILKRAGYQVTWIDNDSGCKGVCNRVEQYQIPKNIKDKWCNHSECLDAMLVDALHTYLQQLPRNDQQNRVVVLHQIGSHGPAYYKRTPAEQRKFMPICNTNAIQECSRDTLINVYDNSIVYTDHILSEVIELLKQSPLNQQTMMWYLSDHGESTGEHGLYLHGAPYMFAPTQQTHIPMLMWLSDAWQKNHPTLKSCLSKQMAQPLSQDNLFPTLLSLLDVESKVKNPELDMLAKCEQ